MIKVGGEVDAVCTKCQMTLAHTVHAVVAGRPVKVECNTCHGVHRYKGTLGGSSAARSSGPRAEKAARERPTVVAFDELLSKRDLAAVQPYSPKLEWAVDQVMDHPIFGRGFVSAVRDGGKIEVTFRGDVKILVHGR